MWSITGEVVLQGTTHPEDSWKPRWRQIARPHWESNIFKHFQVVSSCFQFQRSKNWWPLQLQVLPLFCHHVPTLGFTKRSFLAAWGITAPNALQGHRAKVEQGDLTLARWPWSAFIIQQATGNRCIESSSVCIAGLHLWWAAWSTSESWSRTPRTGKGLRLAKVSKCDWGRHPFLLRHQCCPASSARSAWPSFFKSCLQR